MKPLWTLVQFIGIACGVFGAVANDDLAWRAAAAAGAALGFLFWLDLRLPENRG